MMNVSKTSSALSSVVDADSPLNISRTTPSSAGSPPFVKPSTASVVPMDETNNNNPHLKASTTPSSSYRKPLKRHNPIPSSAPFPKLKASSVSSSLLTPNKSLTSLPGLADLGVPHKRRDSTSLSENSILEQCKYSRDVTRFPSGLGRGSPLKKPFNQKLIMVERTPKLKPPPPMQLLDRANVIGAKPSENKHESLSDWVKPKSSASERPGPSVEQPQTTPSVPGRVTQSPVGGDNRSFPGFTGDVAPRRSPQEMKAPPPFRNGIDRVDQAKPRERTPPFGSRWDYDSHEGDRFQPNKEDITGPQPRMERRPPPVGGNGNMEPGPRRDFHGNFQNNAVRPEMRDPHWNRPDIRDNRVHPHPQQHNWMENKPPPFQSQPRPDMGWKNQSRNQNVWSAGDRRPIGNDRFQRFSRQQRDKFSQFEEAWNSGRAGGAALSSYSSASYSYGGQEKDQGRPDNRRAEDPFEDDGKEIIIGSHMTSYRAESPPNSLKSSSTPHVSHTSQPFQNPMVSPSVGYYAAPSSNYQTPMQPMVSQMSTGYPNNSGINPPTFNTQQTSFYSSLSSYPNNNYFTSQSSTAPVPNMQNYPSTQQQQQQQQNSFQNNPLAAQATPLSGLPTSYSAPQNMNYPPMTSWNPQMMANSVSMGGVPGTPNQALQVAHQQTNPVQNSVLPTQMPAPNASSYPQPAQGSAQTLGFPGGTGSLGMPQLSAMTGYTPEQMQEYQKQWEEYKVKFEKYQQELAEYNKQMQIYNASQQNQSSISNSVAAGVAVQPGVPSHLHQAGSAPNIQAGSVAGSIYSYNQAAMTQVTPGQPAAATMSFPPNMFPPSMQPAPNANFSGVQQNAMPGLPIGHPMPTVSSAPWNMSAAIAPNQS